VPVPISTDVKLDALIKKRLLKRAAKQCCYWLLRKVTGTRPPWGSLTGIRPTRLFAEIEQAGRDPERTLERLYDVRADKAALIRQIADIQRPYLCYDSRAVDIYVSVPYCVTKCAYCAFHSILLPKNTAAVRDYLDALFQEMGAALRIVDTYGFSVRALYVGGGTPTALSRSQLDALLARLAYSFPRVHEWTVEAGRPDTIDAERLSVLRTYPVTRVSVNPQTMNDATLERIGRAHTAKQTVEAYQLAREYGFNNINMDLIVGLPGESADDFAQTLESVKALGPENLTIHTLARKRASRLYEDPAFSHVDPPSAEEMIRQGMLVACDMGMAPYYLYRQKNMAGSLENIGYAKPGYICRYNLDMMEETTSVIALGAGAISKRIERDEHGQVRIERAPNMMEPARYVERIGDMIARKERLFKPTEHHAPLAGRC